MTVKLKDLNSTEQHLVDVTTTELHKIQGGALGIGAAGGALKSIGGLFPSPEDFKTPTPQTFLSDVAGGVLIAGLGIGATVASGGTVPLLAAGASLSGD